MMKFRELMEAIDRHKAIDLKSHTSGMTSYSHGPNHKGFVDKELKHDVSHRAIHDAAKEAGYRYTKRTDTVIGDRNMTYHHYEKSAGPYSEHHLTVTTLKGSNKVWNVEHKSITDRS